MFEVAIVNKDNTKETYDCLTFTQASFVFFRAKQNKNTEEVTLSELLD